MDMNLTFDFDQHDFTFSAYNSHKRTTLAVSKRFRVSSSEYVPIIPTKFTLVDRPKKILSSDWISAIKDDFKDKI